MESATTPCIIVSNRLPVALSRAPDGALSARHASGGLVTALEPVLRAAPDSLWIGWPGCDEDPAAAAALTAARGGFDLAPVWIPPADRDLFYLGFCNAVLWPLFHDLQSLCNFDPDYFRCYERVNAAFAEAVAARAPQGGRVWIHDYHLMLVTGDLQARRPDLACGFFLHIPFPPPDMFAKLPWRKRILEGLLAHRLTGFQTPRDLQNFAACCRTFLGARVTEEGRLLRVEWSGRTCLAGAFPISIDAHDFARRAATPEVTDKARGLRAMLHDRQIILGVDRLDYTKGIPQRLRSFHTMLQRHPDLRGKVTFVQVVVPSREEIPSYAKLKAEIEQLVSRINGEFTDIGQWVPIHYVYRHMEPSDLLAWYRAAQVALVTPLKDGMNLVAKEYCACSLEKDCSLVLSEFAGAADELRDWAILVNPNDREGVADALAEACRMPDAERRTAMGRMRRHIFRHDVFRFARDFLGTLDRHAAPTAANPSLTARIRDLAASPHRPTLILDYDGTLAPIEKRPELAAPDPELLGLLARLAEAFSVHVVSGRPRGTLSGWLGALPIGLHGEHGLWSRMPGEEWESNADVPEGWLRAWMGEIEPILAAACREFKGSFIERKEKSIAWHYRAVPEAGLAQKAALGLVGQVMNLPVLRETVDLAGFLLEGKDAGEAWRRKLAPEEEQAEDAAEALVERAGALASARGVEALHGHKVLEFRVKGIHKGLIVPRVVHPGHPVLAAGDDRTDEDLFRNLPEQAIRIKVGDGPTSATYRVADPAEFRRTLVQLAEWTTADPAGGTTDTPSP